jgi:putative peptidoglycan lipid II flippase
MARASGEGRRGTVQRLAHETFRIMLMIALPLTAFTVVLAVPAVSVVFRRGEFTAHDAHLVGLALMVYASSLVFSAAQRAILTTWLADLNTRMQLSSAVVGMVAEFVLLAVLIGIFGLHQTSGVIAIALAWSIAQVVITAYCLHHAWRDHQLSYRQPAADLVPWALVTLVAGAAMAVAYRVLAAGTGHRWTLFAKGAGVGLIGAAIIGGAGLVMFGSSARRRA